MLHLFAAAVLLADLETVPAPEIVAYMDKVAASIEPGWSTAVTEPQERMWEPYPIGHHRLAVPVPMLRQARSKAELAALFAHAIAHRKLHVEPVGNGRPTIFWIPSKFMPMNLVQKAMVRESEADAEALRLLQSAGYDVAALRSVLDRMPSGTWNDADRIMQLPAGDVPPDAEWIRMVDERFPVRSPKVPRLRRN